MREDTSDINSITTFNYDLELNTNTDNFTRIFDINNHTIPLNPMPVKQICNREKYKKFIIMYFG